MKTKHILMMMAMPTFFAACSSEELVPNQPGNNALSGRKVLGNVELNFGEAGTRIFADKDGFHFNAGDGIGACLVDNYTGETNDAAVKNYKLIEYIQTNYQYKYENGKWATNAKMVEGNYIFYAPYNGDHLSRKPINIEVPIVQELKKAGDGTVDKYSIVNDFLVSGAPAYVGYAFLEAEGQSTKVSVDMKPIMAYPLITFMNGSEEEVTVTKFVIESDDMLKQTPLYIGKKDAIASNGAEGVVGNLFNVNDGDSENGTDEFGKWVKNEANKHGKGNVTSDIAVKEGKKTNDVITISIPEGGIVVGVDESFEFHAVLPAATLAAGTKVYAYLSDGTCAVVSGLADQSFSVGKMYIDAQYDGSGKAYPSTAKKPATMNAKETRSDAPIYVSTNEELIYLIANASESYVEDKTIKIANTDVNIDANVVAAASNPNLVFEIGSDIEVVGNQTSELVLSNIILKNNVTVKGGKVKFGEDNKIQKLTVEENKSKNPATVTVKNNIAAGLTVGNGAIVTVDGTITGAVEVATATVTVNNNIAGDLSVASGANVTTKNVGNVTNNGTYTLNGVATTLTNNGVATIKKNSTVTTLNNNAGAEVTLEGTNKTDDAVATGSTITTLTNAAAVTGDSPKAAGKVTVNGGSVVTTLNNNGEVTMGAETGATKISNSGTITTSWATFPADAELDGTWVCAAKVKLSSNLTMKANSKLTINTSFDCDANSFYLYGNLVIPENCTFVEGENFMYVYKSALIDLYGSLKMKKDLALNTAANRVNIYETAEYNKAFTTDVGATIADVRTNFDSTDDDLVEFRTGANLLKVTGKLTLGGSADFTKLDGTNAMSSIEIADGGTIQLTDDVTANAALTFNFLGAGAIKGMHVLSSGADAAHDININVLTARKLTITNTDLIKGTASDFVIDGEVGATLELVGATLGEGVAKTGFEKAS